MKKTETEQTTAKTPAPAKTDNVRISSLALTLAIALITVAVLLAIWLDNQGVSDLWIGIAFALPTLAALYILFGLKVAQQWEKAVVLRLGKFKGLRGPGMFWILPVIDATPNWIDHRVMVTPFNAEKALTKDAT
jgi:hypothetical protein